MKIQNVFNVANYKPQGVNNFYAKNLKGLTKDTVSFTGTKLNSTTTADDFRTKEEKEISQGGIIADLANTLKKSSEELYATGDMKGKGSYITSNQTADGTVDVIETASKTGQTKKKSKFLNGTLQTIEYKGTRGSNSASMYFEYMGNNGELSSFRLLEKAGEDARYETTETAEFENGVMRSHTCLTGPNNENEPVIQEVSTFDNLGNLDSYTKTYKRPIAEEDV